MTANVAPKQELNLETYIILPRKDSKDILVSQTRTDQDLNWYKTHEVLHQEGFLMPTPRQFFDFLNLLQSKRRVYNGKGNPLNPNTRNDILNDILEQREPWRAEYLDAYFAEIKDKMHIFYDHRTIHGELRATKVEPLEECLMEEGYINLTGINKQGLPTKKSRAQTYRQEKNIYFWQPSDDSVAWFGAVSVGVGLSCSGDPQGSFSGLGVRRQKFF